MELVKWVEHFDPIFANSLQRDKVLIVGSGKTAPQIKDWNLAGWSLVTMNNAHMVRPDWEFAGFSPDLPKERQPVDNVPFQYTFSALTGPKGNDERLPSTGQRGFEFALRHYNKQHLDTTFFGITYWVLRFLQPRIVGFMGCDMNYDLVNDSTHFYGMGLDTGNNQPPDPLRFFKAAGLDPAKCLIELQNDANKQGCELVNFSKELSRLPYNHIQWK